MNPKVSLVVPVYNVEKYIEECLNSVINQSYDNYEVILVDDGSTDRSGIICDNFARAKSNVKVVHQNNQGLSGARNCGVKVSNGEYITFVDSDDLISNDYIKILTEGIQGDTDVVIAKIVKFFSVIPKIRPNEIKIYKLNTVEALIDLCNQKKFGNSACAKLYKRNLVEKYPYPIGKYYEDLATTHKIIGAANSIVFIDRVVYYYRQRHDSIMNHDGLSEKDFYALEAAKNQMQYIEQEFPEAVPAAKGRCVVAGFDLLRLIRTGSKENKKQFIIIQEYVKALRADVMKSRIVNEKSKLKCFAICMGYYPAIICSKMFEITRKVMN